MKHFKHILLIGALVALLCGCGPHNTQTKTPAATTTETQDTITVEEENIADMFVEVAKESIDTMSVRYLNALPKNFREDDCFDLVLDYGGYAMDAEAWPMPDGDWLIAWHWCIEEDGNGTITFIDTDGIEKPVVYNDPFEGRPYPVLHNPKLSLDTRNYDGETVNFYSAPNSNEILCSTNKIISMDVISADIKTRRLLVYSAEHNLKGWVDEEWICGSTITTCS